MKTSNKNYKILVLSDLKEPITNVLKSTISLAKIIGADIQFFHVKRAAEIVETDNQLSAMRKINREYITTDKKIRKEVFSFSSNFDVSINYAFSFGNVKEEIVKYIKDYKPDVIVLGKRKKNPLSIIGDNVTQFIMKNHKGAIMIASEKEILEPNQPISLGLLNEKDTSINIDFAEDLMKHAQQPLMSFNIVKNSNSLEKNPTPVSKNKVEYIFEKSDSVIKNLSNYISKNNINLLCVNRKNDYAFNKLNVSLLVTN